MPSHPPAPPRDASTVRSAAWLLAVAAIAAAVVAAFVTAGDATTRATQEVHDVGLTSCVNQGPAPINLSDTGGAYMYLACRLNNHSDHDEWVVMSEPGSLLRTAVPAGCLAGPVLIVPGSAQFTLPAGETLDVMYRIHWQCHAPAVESTFSIQATMRADHQNAGSCAADDDPANNFFSVSTQGVIGPVAPESTPGPTPTPPPPTTAASDPCEDSDGDGFTNSAEWHVGTEPGAPCGIDGWPADIFGTDASYNKVNIQDIASFIAPARHLDTSPGDPQYAIRWDIVPGTSIFTGQINIQDILAVALVRPPMLGGLAAFNQVCPGNQY